MSFYASLMPMVADGLSSVPAGTLLYLPVAALLTASFNVKGSDRALCEVSGSSGSAPRSLTKVVSECDTKTLYYYRPGRLPPHDANETVKLQHADLQFASAHSLQEPIVATILVILFIGILGPKLVSRQFAITHQMNVGGPLDAARVDRISDDIAEPNLHICSMSALLLSIATKLFYIAVLWLCYAWVAFKMRLNVWQYTFDVLYDWIFKPQSEWQFSMPPSMFATFPYTQFGCDGLSGAEVGSLKQDSFKCNVEAYLYIAYGVWRFGLAVIGSTVLLGLLIAVECVKAKHWRWYFSRRLARVVLSCNGLTYNACATIAQIADRAAAKRVLKAVVRKLEAKRMNESQDPQAENEHAV